MFALSVTCAEIRLDLNDVEGRAVMKRYWPSPCCGLLCALEGVVGNVKMSGQEKTNPLII